MRYQIVAMSKGGFINAYETVMNGDTNKVLAIVNKFLSNKENSTVEITKWDNNGQRI